MYWLSRKRNLAVMLLPALLIYSAYIIMPIFISLYYSLTRYSGIGKAEFIAFGNYLRLFQNPMFRRAVQNSMTIMGCSLLVLLPLSFLVANLLNTRLRGAAASKAIVFSPNIMAPIIVGIIWTFIFDPVLGCLNAFFDLLGLPGLRQQWIGGLTMTPYSVAVVYIWQQLGYMTTLFIAGLKMVPEDLYESAMIDGASGWQKMRYITIPVIRNTITIVAILIINGTLKIFEVVLQLTGGGPNHYSETMVTYSYNTTFLNREYGYGMSMAVVIFLLCFGLSVLSLRMNRQTEN